jgi:hypothetical protein
MKYILAAFLGASLIAAAPAGAQPQSDGAAKLAEAHAIIQIMFPPDQRQQMMDKLLTTFEAQMRPAILKDAMADPGLKALVDAYADKVLTAERPAMQKHIPAIMEASATAYTREFSLAELKDIHAFALTPSGRRYLQRSSSILSDPAVAKVNQDLAIEAQATAKALIPEFKEKLIEYLKAHPDVAAKVKAQES